MRTSLRVGALTLVTVGVAATAVALGLSGGAGTGGPLGLPDSPDRPPAPGPAALAALITYPSCADMLAGLRQHAAANVTAWGLAGQEDVMAVGAARAGAAQGAPGVPAPAAPERGAQAAAPATPEHSTTNVHEAGVDEADVVKTDGNRVVTVAQGVLRVVDAATRQVTVQLRIDAAGQAWGPADLLVSGDRALVLLPGTGIVTPGMRPPGGPIPAESLPAPSGFSARYVLVDISSHPRVLGTLTVPGTYVDARMVGSTVRLVVRTQPNIVFPPVPPQSGEETQLENNQATVRKAPIEAWLPRYEVSDPSGTRSVKSVPCDQVRHPRDYTGTSMLTIYSIDLARGLHDIAPVSLAADGDIVYGTTSTLYVASNPRWWAVPMMKMPQGGVAVAPSEPLPSPPLMPRRPVLPPERTQIFRFDITGDAAPRYTASGTVPGRLLNQYSLSEYDGYLRVATTSNGTGDGTPANASSAVYELRADSLALVGEVGGLGKGQRIYSVRFIGPLGYVVTFRQMDPLYTLDLRDPRSPRVAGDLEINGYSSYLHPGATDRLVGIGQEADANGRAQGLQVSLFDVSDPASPQRLAHWVRPDTGSAAEADPHAFLYWPDTSTAVLPYQSWTGGRYGAGALVLKVADSGIDLSGTITLPATSPSSGQGILRAIMIGHSVWTVSTDGLLVSDASTLAEQAWIAYS